VQKPSETNLTMGQELVSPAECSSEWPAMFILHDKIRTLSALRMASDHAFAAQFHSCVATPDEYFEKITTNDSTGLE